MSGNGLGGGVDLKGSTMALHREPVAGGQALSPATGDPLSPPSSATPGCPSLRPLDTLPAPIRQDLGFDSSIYCPESLQNWQHIHPTRCDLLAVSGGRDLVS